LITSNKWLMPLAAQTGHKVIYQVSAVGSRDSSRSRAAETSIVTRARISVGSVVVKFGRLAESGR